MHIKSGLFLLAMICTLSGISKPFKPVLTDYGNPARTIQFDVKPILNARMVTVFSDGKLITWNKGVDGSWSGLATRTAADAMGSKDKVAFPDNGSFAANAFHPFVVLHFSNADANGNQVRFTERNTADSYSFPVAENYYAHISLFFMSAFGTSDIVVGITYSDNSTQQKKFQIEDWATRLPENETRYFLSANLAKWSNTNTELEKDNHYLTGINIQPLTGKRVVKITIQKPASGSTLSFWGATGYGVSSPEWTIPGHSPEISYEGRTVVTHAGSVKQGYPGIVTRVRFLGTDLSMNTSTLSDELYLDLRIDDAAPVFLKVPKGESNIILAKGLTKSEHSVTIYKRVESYVGIFELLSMTVTGDFLPAKSLPERKLMFLGDSFTAGQATTVEDGGPMDPSKAMRQNARLSYPRLIADNLNAQCHIIAYAGRGVIRDWQGNTAVRCAPEYYEYAMPDDETTLWNHKAYVPDAIGVCLGINDFDVGVPEQISYVNAFTEFLRKLRRDAPDACIFLITSPSLTDEPGRVPMRTVQLAYLEEIAKHMQDPKVFVVQLPHYPGVPGDWHPSGTAHRAVATELEPRFRKALGW